MPEQNCLQSPRGCQRLPAMLVGLICSSCGLGFTSEEELRDHQVSCRSSFEFLSQFGPGAAHELH